jgi:hypothetical protein
MKKPIRLIPVILVVLVIASLSSCQKNAENFGKGNAEFSISLPDDAGLLKSASMIDSGAISYQLMVSVTDMEGNSILTDKLIPVYEFGTGFVSENIEINAGDYKLTKFMVINPSGSVIYASPLAGSSLAYLVNKPLPIGFNITPGTVTRIAPEVLTVGDQSPEQFGYVSFGVQVIKPLVFYTMCVLDPGNPLIMAPIQITNAKLTVYANNGWHYTFNLEPKVNKLIIRGGSDNYKFLLEKDGYAPQTLQFSAAQLLAATYENPLILKIDWNSQYKVLMLQPGPEAGKDAMISNLEADKNFGGHKYFEATFLSEPVLTVMRSNRSLIFFNLEQVPKSAIIKKVMLQLWYDLPIPFDSTYIVPGTTPSSFVGGVLQQVTEPWEEMQVTWNKQPASIEANQVLIPPFIRNVNFITVDVTRLIVPMTANMLPNHGMKFKLSPENSFPGFRFASSDFPEPAMRPKLIIYYTLQ